MLSLAVTRVTNKRMDMITRLVESSPLKKYFVSNFWVDEKGATSSAATWEWWDWEVALTLPVSFRPVYFLSVLFSGWLLVRRDITCRLLANEIAAFGSLHWSPKTYYKFGIIGIGSQNTIEACDGRIGYSKIIIIYCTELATFCLSSSICLISIPHLASSKSRKKRVNDPLSWVQQLLRLTPVFLSFSFSPFQFH